MLLCLTITRSTRKGSPVRSNPDALASRLYDLAMQAGAVPFRDPAGRLYVSFAVQGHHEHHPIHSQALRSWLQQLGHASTGRLPGREALAQAIERLEAEALFNGRECQTFVRIADHEGGIYLDLGDPDWRAICVTPYGWGVVTTPPVKFRRPRGLRPLPIPIPGGCVEELRPFLNLPDADAFRLVTHWLVGALRGRGPYVILGLYGQQGSTKSTTARVLRRLVDPNTAELRSEPHEVRDLMVGANNAHVLAFDNVSTIRPWLSDAICRLATGGGFATRELYSDDQETLIDAQRPVIINSIVDVFTRPDLLDRAIIIRLDDLPDTKRRAESDYWAAFVSAQGRILGALLDSVVVALRDEPTIHLAALPRMADFAKWSVASAGALPWGPDTFLQAYEANRAQATVALLETDPVALAIQRMLAVWSHGYWEGTATDLLPQLQNRGEAISRFETDPRKATAALRRLAPALRAVGIYITTAEKHGGRRIYQLMDIRQGQP
ncbi:MAG TPA: hypothetical protein VMO26_01840 [Vicinamibacterales bacterium]|nr:hypothetical protein [Vicinamibacterales bacterium]